MTPVQPLKTWYFTFGSNHLLGLHSCVKMNRMTYDESRNFMNEMVGNKWAFQYDEEVFQELLDSQRLVVKRVFNRKDLPGALRERHDVS